MANWACFEMSLGGFFPHLDDPGPAAESHAPLALGLLGGLGTGWKRRA